LEDTKTDYKQTSSKTGRDAFYVRQEPRGEKINRVYSFGGKGMKRIQGWKIGLCGTVGLCAFCFASRLGC